MENCHGVIISLSLSLTNNAFVVLCFPKLENRDARLDCRDIRDDVECAIMSLKSNINQFLLEINWDDECVCAMFV